MGLSQNQEISDKRGEKIAGEWKKSGAVKTIRSPFEMVRQTRERNKQEAPAQPAKNQGKKKVGQSNLGKVAQAQGVIMGGKTAKSSIGGQNAVHSTSQLQETRTSALEKPEKFGPETTTSILRGKKSDTQKPAEEKKPQAVDLVID